MLCKNLWAINKQINNNIRRRLDTTDKTCTTVFGRLCVNAPFDFRRKTTFHCFAFWQLLMGSHASLFVKESIRQY